MKKLLDEDIELGNKVMALITLSIVCNDFCKQACDMGAGELAMAYMRTSMDNSTKDSYRTCFVIIYICKICCLFFAILRLKMQNFDLEK